MPNPAEHLRSTSCAVAVHFQWLGVRKTLSAGQKQVAAEAFHADRDALSAGKRLFNTRNPAFRAVTAIKGEIVDYWKRVTLPFPEDGLRLIRRESIEAFDARLQEFSARLDRAVTDLDIGYEELIAEARSNLGDLFNPGDYPATLRGKFRVTWEFPNVEPPAYLRELNPRLYEEQQRLAAARFEEAINLAEQAFATELHELITNLRERLTDGEGGKKVFRNTLVTNLTDFIERFRALNVGSSPELDRIVEQARALIAGRKPDDLRDSTRLRAELTEQFGAVQQALEAGIVTAPRRRIAGLDQTPETEQQAPAAGAAD